MLNDYSNVMDAPISDLKYILSDDDKNKALIDRLHDVTTEAKGYETAIDVNNDLMEAIEDANALMIKVLSAMEDFVDDNEDVTEIDELFTILDQCQTELYAANASAELRMDKFP